MTSSIGLKTQSVPALERGLHILEYLAQSRRGVTLSQVAHKLQMPRSTGHALLVTYQRCGYVLREKESGRYTLSPRLRSIANMALGGISLREHCTPFLHQLMQRTGLTVHLAVLEEGEAVLIEKISPPGAPKVNTWIGKKFPLHCTALGKALIAHLPPAEFESLITKQGLIRHNDNTIASVRKLKMACEQVKLLGYSVDDEEEEIDTRCVGAPVRNSKAQVVAAISGSGTKAQIEDLSAAGTIVRDIGASLSRYIGSL
ncbi:MAG TPA: IclR family transcriptional regulator [Alloacidobacterium sp.]|nr:IclR family transcriptional regulator [Alloacidobacterium sp.]